MPSEHDKIDTQQVVAGLNTILELELAGVVRYVHYSLMVFGHARIPIIGWLRNRRPPFAENRQTDRVPQARHHSDSAGIPGSRARHASRVLQPARAGT
jgi:hypothetical protein